MKKKEEEKVKIEDKTKSQSPIRPILCQYHGRGRSSSLPRFSSTQGITSSFKAKNLQAKLKGRSRSPELRGRSKSSAAKSRLVATVSPSRSHSRSPARSDRSGASHRFGRELVENKYGRVQCYVEVNPEARLNPTGAASALSDNE